MELSPYIDSLRRELEAAAAAGGDQARATAALLGVALDSSLRLCLVDALSAMAAEVTAATDGLAVEIRMHGREPQVVVAVDDPSGGDEPPAAACPPPGPADDDDDGAVARITLRLPEALKAQAEALAAAQGVSVNSWLVRSVATAVGRPDPRRDGRGGSWGAGRRLSGFHRS